MSRRADEEEILKENKRRFVMFPIKYDDVSLIVQDFALVSV